MTPAAIARRAARLDPPPADLLRRFAADRDPEAFAGLVRQLGPVVLGTCRRVLGPSPDADDAFQAVFVALARQAGRFRDARALPAWLHRVALRTARKLAARRSAGTRRLAPAGSPEPIDPADPFAEVAWKDLRRVLDEELDRLPEQYRGPVVVCWLDGLPQDEAAGRLGVSLNTVKRRLAAGRELLRSRLVRRGVAPVVLAAALDPTGLRAAVPPGLLAAAAGAARTAAPAAGLRGVAVTAAAAIATAVGIGASIGPAPVPGDESPAAAVAGPELSPPPRPARPAGRAINGPFPTPAAQYGSLHYRVPGGINGTASTPDGKLLAVARARHVLVYDAVAWKLVQTLEADDGEGHWGFGRTLSFSPDGKYLGYARSGKSVFVLDRATGKATNWFGDTDRLRWQGWCQFTREGRLAAADRDRLYWYDPEGKDEPRSVPAGLGVVPSPAGDTFLRAEGTAEATEFVLRDARTEAVVHRLDGPIDRLGGQWVAAFAPDGKTLAYVPEPGQELHLWDVAAGQRLAALKPPGDLFPDSPGEATVGFTADGRTVFLRLGSGDLARWDAKTRRELPTLKAGAGWPLGGLHNLPDGKTVLTPSYPDGRVRVWDGTTGAEVPVPGRYRYAVTSAVAPDGRVIAVGDDTGRIDLLDAATGRPVRELRADGGSCAGLAFSPDGRLIGVAENVASPQRIEAPTVVRVLRVEDGREVRTFKPGPGPNGGWVNLIGFTPEGRELVVAVEGGCRVVDVGTGGEVRAFEGVGWYPGSLSPDGRRLAVGTREETRVLEVATGKVVCRLPVADGDIIKSWALDGLRFGWSADGKTLVTARPTDLVTVHDIETGRETGRFSSFPDGYGPGFKGLIDTARLLTTAVAVSPDGRRAATVGWGGPAVLVWDIPVGRLVARLDTGSGASAVAFTPDGRSVVTTGSVDAGVGYRWDIATAIAAGRK
jgi:RNA polymerase sigma factor (sigma-70 family)